MDEARKRDELEKEIIIYWNYISERYRRIIPAFRALVERDADEKEKERIRKGRTRKRKYGSKDERLLSFIDTKDTLVGLWITDKKRLLEYLSHKTVEELVLIRNDWSEMYHGGSSDVGRAWTTITVDYSDLHSKNERSKRGIKRTPNNVGYADRLNLMKSSWSRRGSK